MVIFVTINARRKPTPTTTCRGPPEWQEWKGRSPLNARYIAQEATKLFYQCGYNNFKFVKIYQTNKRKIDRAMRYRSVILITYCKDREERVSQMELDFCKRNIEIKFAEDPYNVEIDYAWNGITMII
uniref:Uncharacterized protein n=1 Tax=Strongyloides venezuelensis TaxID=75913 RepID=A0A0K0EYW5_STRVS